MSVIGGGTGAWGVPSGPVRRMPESACHTAAACVVREDEACVALPPLGVSLRGCGT